MKPKMDHKVQRPDGKRYDMGAETDLRSKFAAIRREQAAAVKKQADADAEAFAKTTPLIRRSGGMK